jgi:hypothetical protein
VIIEGLVAEEDHLVLQQGLANCGDRTIAQHLLQINPANLGPNAPTQGLNI